MDLKHGMGFKQYLKCQKVSQIWAKMIANYELNKAWKWANKEFIVLISPPLQISH